LDSRLSTWLLEYKKMLYHKHNCVVAFPNSKVDKFPSKFKSVVNTHPQAEWLKLLKVFGVNPS
jgi:hypothetical protein